MGRHPILSRIHGPATKMAAIKPQLAGVTPIGPPTIGPPTAARAKRVLPARHQRQGQRVRAEVGPAPSGDMGAQGVSGDAR